MIGCVGVCLSHHVRVVAAAAVDQSIAVESTQIAHIELLVH